MSRFWSPFVKDLVPYVPGEQPKLARLVKLNTNENPYGPSPKALEAMRGELNDNLRLYPDPNGDRLKQAVAEYYGVTPGQVFVGNGSDEVLAHIFHGLFQHDAPLLFPDISYSFYPVYCGLYGIAFEQVALDEQFQIRVQDYNKPNAGIIFPNPNAPTGCLMPLQAVEQLTAKGFEVLPSAANFIFARHPQQDAAELAARLREQGVIVRHFKQARIAQFLRITIGTPEMNQALLDALN